MTFLAAWEAMARYGDRSYDHRMQGDPLGALKHVLQLLFAGILALGLLVFLFYVLPAKGKAALAAALAFVTIIVAGVVRFGALEFIRVLVTIALAFTFAWAVREYMLYEWSVASKVPILSILGALAATVTLNYRLHWPPSLRTSLWTLGPLPVMVSIGSVLARIESRRAQERRRRGEEERKRQEERFRLEERREVVLRAEARREAEEDARREQGRLVVRAAEQRRREEAGRLEEERLRQQREQYRLEMKHAERLKREEAEAILEGESADCGLSPREHVQREIDVLEKVYALVRGVAGRRAKLIEVAEGVRLSPGRIKSTLDALQARGLVRVHGVETPEVWTDKEVEITERGAERVSDQYGSRGEGRVSYVDKSITFQESVTTASIGDNNKVDHNIVSGGHGSSETHQALLKAINEVIAGINDPYKAKALEDEVIILESSSSPTEKIGAVHRVVGMAKMLGAVGTPILEVANGVKEFFS